MQDVRFAQKLGFAFGKPQLLRGNFFSCAKLKYF